MYSLSDIAFELVILDDLLADGLRILRKGEGRDCLLETQVGWAETDYQVGMGVVSQAILQYMSQLGVSERDVYMLLILLVLMQSASP